MDDKNAWTMVHKNSIQGNVIFIPMKWVFKFKSYKRYIERLVSKGYKQIEGIEYYSSHAPVLTEISFRLLI